MFSKDSFTLPAVQAMRNEIFVGTFFGDVSFTAVAVLISAVSAIDLTCSFRALARSDPLMGEYQEIVSPIAKVPISLHADGLSWPADLI